MKDIGIRKVQNGYIITDRYGLEEIYTTLQKVFERLLLHYEGLASTFTGSSHGEVIIRRGVEELTLSNEH